MPKINNERLAQFHAMSPEDQQGVLADFDEPTQAEIKASYKDWKDKTQPGLAESLFRGGAKGALMNFSDELAGGVGALTDKAYRTYHNYAHPDSQVRNDLGEEYRDNKADWNARDAQAEREHGTAFTGAEIGGSALSSMLPGANIGKGVVGAIGTGAATGALSSLGASEADLTSGKAQDWVTAGEDTLMGGGAGALLGGGFYGAGKGATALAGKAGDFAGMQAFKAVHPALKDFRTTNEAEAIAMGKQLLKEKGLKFFGRATKNLANQLEPLAKEAGAEIGSVTSKLVDEGAAQGRAPLDPKEVAQALKNKGADRYPTSADRGSLDLVNNEADALAQHYNGEGGGPDFDLHAMRKEKTGFAGKGAFDAAVPSANRSAFRGMSHDLREIIETEAKEISPELHGQLLKANERFAALKPAEKMATEATVKDLARKFGVPVLDVFAGLAALKMTDNSRAGVGTALAAHLILTRGKGTSASMLNALSKGAGALGQPLQKFAGRAGGRLAEPMLEALRAREEEQQ